MTFTITQEKVLWAYGILHVLFGLVTHYHSVSQVKAWNKKRPYGTHSNRISSLKMSAFFVVRMALAFPVFCIARILSPTGNKWHMTPEEIEEFSYVSDGVIGG